MTKQSILYLSLLFYGLVLGACTVNSDDPPDSIRISGFKQSSYNALEKDSQAAIDRGAKLYDQWFAPGEAPADMNPMLANGRVAGMTIEQSWRCVTCHTWSGSGGTFTFSSLLVAQRGRPVDDMFRTIAVGFASNDASIQDHVFRGILTSAQMYDLVYFIKKGMKFPETYSPLPLQGGKAIGNSISGKFWYEHEPGAAVAGCSNAGCHGLDGKGAVQVPIGISAVGTPWRFLHIARFGPAYPFQREPVMPAVHDIFPNDPNMDEILTDILAYVQNSLPVLEIGGNPLRGGRLYDDYFKEKNIPRENNPNPLWENKRNDTEDATAVTAADTWRCITCHGWDYAGDKGAFELGNKSGFYSGFPGLLKVPGRNTDDLASHLINNIRAGYAEGGTVYHRFEITITEQDAKDLVAFILTEMIDTEDYVLQNINNTHGDAERGKSLFTLGEPLEGQGGAPPCISCHVAGAVPSGSISTALEMADVVKANRFLAFHRIRFSPPGQSEVMEPAIKYGLSPPDIADIMAYIFSPDYDTDVQ